MHSLIIFASGKGSNARTILDYFKKNGQAKVALIVTNNPLAGVLEIARNEGVPSLIINKADFGGSAFTEKLREYNPSLLVLAGFLWKIPATMVTAFEGKIINIHPALLPKYGGKGMYGHHVHDAVVNAGERESGITIHYVDEVYDNGSKILQAHCPLDSGDTAEVLADKIHRLEHFFYPRTIEYLLENI